jgi:L-glutamine-phosphate cytidylyltransferase
MNSETKVIILAGGEGKRLRPLTDEKPKCMVEIFGKPILEHQINSLRECQISDITVITGYRSEKINFPNINYVKNKDYEKTNMLNGLFLIPEKLDGSVIISYGDIIYEKNIIMKLLDTKNDFSVVVDKKWKQLWDIRFENPLDDAESLKIDENGNITEIGQKVKKMEEIQGQFIGLMKFENNGLKILKKYYEDFRLKSESEKTNVLNSKLPFECSFMTDFLQALIKCGIKLKSVNIDGGWLELDSTNDFKKYNELYAEGKLKKICNI